MTTYKIITLDDVDSTNEEAKRRIQQGSAEEGLAIVANRQSAGRGRHGRSWSSPAGNLYLSVILKRVEQSSRISFVAALAVADAIDACCGRPVAQLKWPNDVLIDARKVSGILIEAEGDWLIVGIGVNVRSAPQTASYKPISLTDIGCDISVEAICGQILGKLSKRLKTYKPDTFSAIRDAWLERAWQLNKPVILRDHNQEARGIFTGLDEDGFCLLQTEEGLRRFTSGSFFAEAA